MKPDNGENLTATVEIIGLPKGCQSTDSEIGSVCGCVNYKLFDEFSIPPSRIDKMRLDNSINEIQENPYSQIYIIEYFKRGAPQKVVDRKIQKITDYFVYEKLISKDRFTILTANSEDEQNRTKFWIVPPGANVPKP